ncbi:MAG: hypothetical protein GYB64_17140, partial [Chloroflexi bacterium]|nr:hypothetical protein [Chloroflexota bacterium]
NWMEPPAAEVEEASSPAPPAEAARSGPSPIVVGLLVVVLLCLLTVLGGMIAVATGVVSIPGELSVETIDGGGAIDDFYDTARTESITVGGTGSGTIANEFDAHNWLLTVDGPQTITVRVEGTADTDPWLFVYDSAGNQLAENDDIDFDTYDSLVTVDLPAAGTYTLRVVTWGGGAYTISVQ